MRQALGLIALATLVTVPALYLRLTGSHTELVADTTLYGLAIVAAAFLLAWAAEAAEVDISQALAVAFIAFVAVLPEYAVDLTFAWKAGQDPEFAPYAVANMTGSNRLLIGLGWSVVFLIFWIRTRGRVLSLDRSNALDVVALASATLYSFTIPLKGSISLLRHRDPVRRSSPPTCTASRVRRARSRTSSGRRPGWAACRSAAAG